MGCKDVLINKHPLDVGLGDRETWDLGTWDVVHRGTGMRGHGTQGRADKQTSPEFCTEFAINNFWWSRKRNVLCDGEFASSC